MKRLHPDRSARAAGAASSGDPPGEVPLYKEVRRRILDALARGEWQPGERLPNEADLARRFGVAISTVRAGVGELTSAGVLVRRQGKGTFVVRHDRHVAPFRFSNIVDESGRKITTTRRVTAIRRVRADAATAALLGLAMAEAPQVHRVQALLGIEGRTVAIMELVLPCALFPELKRADLENTAENLYAVYQRHWGITALRMEERVAARTADAADADALGVARGHPLLLVERVTYTFNDRPIEVRRRLYEGLAHHYVFMHESLD